MARRLIRIDPVACTHYYVLPHCSLTRGIMIDKMRWQRFASTLLLMTCAGCGGSKPNVGTVHGRVTLDGQALPNASVVFSASGNSPSGGKTDKDGNYELIYRRGIMGAAIGTNRVSILEDTLVTHKPQRVPTRYNQESELEREVKPGDNVIDFDLTTEKK